MNSTTPTFYERYLPWRRPVEIGFWIGLFGINAAANSVTTLIELRRLRLDVATWEPVVWEFSSASVLLALTPALVWFTRQRPLYWDNWRRQLPWHLLASLVYSLTHILSMVGLRHAVYRLNGATYDFGHWPIELLYEYLKDVRTYAAGVLIIESYRLILRRLQGEARLLDAPDEGPSVEPIERPERFLVRKLGREFLIGANEIEWLQAAGNYVNLYVRSHAYPLRSTISSIEARLDPNRFVRIHRSYLVNMEQIASIEPLESGDARVHLKNGTTLPCSRRYRARLR